MRGISWKNVTPVIFAAFAASGPSTIVTIVIDDLGHYDTAVYNPNSPTPALKGLADAGVRLGRHCEFTRMLPRIQYFLFVDHFFALKCSKVTRYCVH